MGRNTLTRGLSPCDPNADYIVWDLIPRNVLRDHDGDIFVVDAEIKRK